MNRVRTFWHSTIGKKIGMAVTGLVMVGFLIAHVSGNLLVFRSPEEFNRYAAFLKGLGGFLWVARAILLASVVLHIVAAVQLAQRAHAARPVSYQRRDPQVSTFAVRTIRWSGALILLFVVLHLLHFTTGQAHPDFVEGGVYHNFVVAFRNPLVLVAYLVAQAALGLHLYHGLWSATQTLGANHPKYNRLRRPAAAVVALAIFFGFVVPPVLVAVGVIS